MSTIISERSMVLHINGIEVKGFANVSPVIDWPEAPFFNFEFGKDGRTYGSDTGNVGGEIVVHLLPTSPFVRQLIAWRNEWVNGEPRTVFSGSYRDATLNIGVSFREGYLVSCPMFPSPGKVFEVGFYFEHFISDIETAKFSEPPMNQGRDRETIGDRNSHEGTINPIDPQESLPQPEPEPESDPEERRFIDRDGKSMTYEEYKKQQAERIKNPKTPLDYRRRESYLRRKAFTERANYLYRKLGPGRHIVREDSEGRPIRETWTFEAGSDPSRRGRTLHTIP